MISRGQLGRAAEKLTAIRQQALANGPDAQRQSKRLSLLTYLHALAQETQLTLDRLRDLKPKDPLDAPPTCLKAAPPIAPLRTYLLDLMDMRRKAAGIPGDDQDFLRGQIDVAQLPAPGHELIDACQLLAFYLQQYLVVETEAEAATVTGLPLETWEDRADEAARAEIPEAAQNKSLARMKVHDTEKEGEARELTRSTKEIERRRKRIDGWLRPYAEAFREATEIDLRVLEKAIPGEHRDEDELGRVREQLKDPLASPEMRLAMKRWLTSLVVLDSAERWRTRISEPFFTKPAHTHHRTYGSTSRQLAAAVGASIMGGMADVPVPDRHPDQEVSPVQVLEQRLGRGFPALSAARELAREKRAKLACDLQGIVSADLSIVAFGSLARDEFTPDSDADWSLLVDGQADSTHFDTAREVESIVKRVISKEPGREGVFGKMTFSHELVHLIGGENDTNSNTTRRALLLLESVPLAGEQVHTRVVRAILKRYLLEEPSFAKRTKRHHVPRFLLNDFARYWRTMAVDFAYKSRARKGDTGLALRRIKLRTSRKLIFASGLLSCFSCQLGLARHGGPQGCPGSEEECVECLGSLMRRKPLELFAAAALHLADRQSTAGEVSKADRLLTVAGDALAAYDQFLAILSDRTRRGVLDGLSEEGFDDAPAFVEAKKICDDFRDAIETFFFEADDGLARLTRHYGVF